MCTQMYPFNPPPFPFSAEKAKSTSEGGINIIIQSPKRFDGMHHVQQIEHVASHAGELTSPPPRLTDPGKDPGKNHPGGVLTFANVVPW